MLCSQGTDHDWDHFSPSVLHIGHFINYYYWFSLLCTTLKESGLIPSRLSVWEGGFVELDNSQEETTNSDIRNSLKISVTNCPNIYPTSVLCLTHVHNKPNGF